MANCSEINMMKINGWMWWETYQAVVGPELACLFRDDDICVYVLIPYLFAARLSKTITFRVECMFEPYEVLVRTFQHPQINSSSSFRFLLTAAISNVR